jgi:ankyrin repeat protein
MGAETPEIIEATLRGDLDGIRRAAMLPLGVDARDRDERTALMHGVIDGMEAAVDLLLALGASPAARDRSGWTPLHFAVAEHRVDLAKRLVEAGAPVDMPDSHGNTPLWRAVFTSQGRGDLIQLLLSSGADKSAPNHSGVSPEDLAKKIANYDIRRLLEPGGRI